MATHERTRSLLTVRQVADQLTISEPAVHPASSVRTSVPALRTGNRP
jgi:hypothetical protein